MAAAAVLTRALNTARGRERSGVHGKPMEAAAKRAGPRETQPGQINKADGGSGLNADDNPGLKYRPSHISDIPALPLTPCASSAPTRPSCPQQLPVPAPSPMNAPPRSSHARHTLLPHADPRHANLPHAILPHADPRHTPGGTSL